eukprot:Nitzschia sp. Nitz4//scaffold133_size116822//95100//96173//NITZ4_003820-RA/size116822-processed-gene-0.39-mRNA-1//1//CDS//3329535435//3582//frame0
MLVEPPVRSRPLRTFRGAARLPTVRKPPDTSASMMKRYLMKGNNVVEDESPKERTGTFPVQAIHVARSVDLAQVISKVFAMKGLRKMLERLSVVVQLPPEPQMEGADASSQAPRFVAVFRYGPVVFFNVSPRETADLMWRIKQCSKDPSLAGNERKETYCVHVHPEPMELEEVVTGEHCVVEELNLKSVDVISNILAQSVALDTYNDTVDELLAQFEAINNKVKGEGSLSAVDRDQMFKAVARNNSIFIEMISKVGLKDRSDTAWNLSQYELVHEDMRAEFEIDQRFEHIEFKLNLIEQNAKFFLEVLTHNKSNMQEWMIIVLIAFEAVLMCLDMSGAGPVFFEKLHLLYQQSGASS